MPKEPQDIEWPPGVTDFKPGGLPLVDLDMVTSTSKELEPIRLVDILAPLLDYARAPQEPDFIG